MTILVVMDTNEDHRKILEAAAGDSEVIYCKNSDLSEEVVKSADIIVGNVPPRYLKDCSKLKLLQLNSAGTDGYTAPGVLPEQAVLTNATGAYGIAISEHMIGSLLLLMKKLDGYHNDMQNEKWTDRGKVSSVWGSHTLVVGLGDIGTEFARRMFALGSSNVTAIRKNAAEKPSFVDHLYQMDKFYECLADADIVAACLPGTAETYKMFNEEAFSHMKDGAYFVNVGRGTAVDTEALYQALISGKLAGAAVDVTDPEPLPEGHPLWKAPNVFITPHVSGGYHTNETHKRIIGIAARNIEHCINNEPYVNVVDMKTGYRKFVK